MRFELVRTLLRKPTILLLDEPLANLDVLAQQLILEDLKNISDSVSNPIGIILSSQQLFEVEKISDKVLFLKNGKPTHLSSANKQKDESTLTVMELDSSASKEELYSALKNYEVSASFSPQLSAKSIHKHSEIHLAVRQSNSCSHAASSETPKCCPAA